MVSTRSTDPTRSSLRRSARLSGSATFSHNDMLQVLQDKTRKQSKKRRRQDSRDDAVVIIEDSLSPNEEKKRRASVVVIVDKGKSSLKGKRERSPSPSSSASGKLKFLEKALKQRERELERKQEDLDSQAQNLEAIAKEKERRTTLEFLDDNMSCSLCCEIIACPYSPTSVNCGHTFCAICILKWFFSRLHGCGEWHEPVQCPFCRTPFPTTPDRPRELRSFPFAPNRLADACIRSALDKLASGSDDAGNLKAEANEARLFVKKEESVGLLAPDSDLNGWLTGGKSRLEWIARDRRGQTEMADIRSRWPRLRSEEFLALKLKLKV